LFKTPQITGREPIYRLIFGAILISFSAVFVAGTSIDSDVLAFYRVAVGGIVLMFFRFRHFLDFKLSKTQLLFAAIASITSTFDLLFWHHSIRLVGPGLSTLLANFQVFIISFAGILCWREKFSWQLLVSIPVAVTGLFLILGVEWAEYAETFKSGVIYGLLTAISYSGYILCLKKIQSSKNPPPEVFNIAIISLGTALLLACVLISKGNSFAIPDETEYLPVIAYGIICQALGWILISGAIKKVRLVLVGLILLLQPLLSYVWDVLFFGKSVSPLEALGVVITILAIYLGSFRNSDK